MTFRAACVYAITGAKDKDDQAKAIAHLRQAVGDGYRDLRDLATNPDLNPIRTHAEFKKICDAAETLK